MGSEWSADYVTCWAATEAGESGRGVCSLGSRGRGEESGSGSIGWGEEESGVRCVKNEA